MRLKQLKLAGFKSFANPTTFYFPRTITAIVGPNGCGKSNVIDAIRWVLGESSAKQLRGGAMSDVIFAGTQDKPAKSLASVELVFEHTQEAGKGGIYHALNLYHELSIRRQMSKDGKSDYFINGTKVRRRDVVDIFLGTGLGARSYAVIEQGMIGRIIEANPQQLREFIEEASGVSRYQSRRHDTQKQLDTARDNLSRLSDMASELSIQQKRLERQAKTAQLAQTWQSELDTINKTLLIDDYGQAWQKQQHLSQEFHAISEQVTAQHGILQQKITQIHTTQRHIIEAQFTHQDAQTQARRHWQQHFETQTLLGQNEKTIANEQNRLNALNFEINRLADYQADLIKQQTQAQAMLADLPVQMESLNRELNTLRDEVYHVRQQREHVASELVVLNKQKTELDKNLAVSENAIKHYNSERERHAKRQQNHEQNVIAWQTAKAKFDGEFTTIETIDFDEKITQLSNQIERLESQIIARQDDLADQGDEVQSLNRQQRQAEQQCQTWQTEQTTLQNLLDTQQNALTKTVQNSNQNAGHTRLPKLINAWQLTEQGKAIAPIFDTLASVFANWAIAEKDQLGENFAESFIFIQQNISNVTDNIDGFVSLSEFIATPKLPIFQHVWLNLVPANFTAFNLETALKKLPQGHWALLQNLANELWLVNSALRLNLTKALTLDESSQHLSQYFSQKIQHQARIDELAQLLTQQKPHRDRLNQALQQANVSLQEWQAQERRARNELLMLTQQKQRFEREKIQSQHRYQSAFDKLQQDKARLDNDSKNLGEETGGFEQKLAEEQQNLASIRQNLATLQPQLQQKIRERQTLDEQITSLSEQQKTWEQQTNRHTQNLATGQLQLRASEQQLAKTQQDIARLKQEHSELSQQIAEQGERLPLLRKQLGEQADQLAQANHNVAQFASQLIELETQLQAEQQLLHTAQTELDNLQSQKHRIDTAVALAQQTVGLIAKQLSQQGIDLPQVENLGLLESFLLKTATRKNAQAQVETLKQKLNELGAVNYSALAELDEVNQRHTPLAEQISDLTASSDKLQQAIKQIDSQTRQLFMAMLGEVNSALNHLFTQVFGGGKAELILTDNDGSHNWQSGLELMAQPKGKKNSRLALLSGGEKTLTALSLVFAIFKQQPAPFCVLDEVDAPLDDANVERFTNLIRELAKEVQFIFISHNKLAMQIADELKGVTMPTAGISKLVSVDMHQIEQYLEA